MAPRKKANTAAKLPAVSKRASQIPVAPPSTVLSASIPPARVHDVAYHYPLLLGDKRGCEALLGWFKGVEESRSMPWRKRWIDPGEFEGKEEELGSVLGRRAYEVWVSEIMLQQTRVATVIPYFTNWISKWPTVEDLAKADHDDVLAAWKGLGYYSRATRLHEGAKAMIAKSSGSSCPLPSKALELQEFPGIGRYTAGAVSSIAFGEPEPVLDGNVARVLSRQLGIYMDVKDKKASDILWDEADRIIKSVSEASGNAVSEIPGQWNQAMMELGSTICTPRPLCDACPIQSTCRAYSEGQALSKARNIPTVVPDIEDSCTLCDPLDIEDVSSITEAANEDDKPPPPKKRKVAIKQSNKISSYFAAGTPSTPSKAESDTEDVVPDSQVDDLKKKGITVPVPSPDSKCITSYCALFPKKVAKKKVAEEECVVCVVELRLVDGTSKWLIEQRPAKGLLASLWQFPQNTLSTASTSASRKSSAQKYTSSLKIGNIDTSSARHIAALPPLVHVFTHLKLTMHTHHFRVDVEQEEDVDLECGGEPRRKWVGTSDVDGETLSTGMKKCWSLISEKLN